MIYIATEDLAKGNHYSYRTQVYLGSDLWVQVSLTDKLTQRPFADLTDVTLADEDTKLCK